MGDADERSTAGTLRGQLCYLTYFLYSQQEVSTAAQSRTYTYEELCRRPAPAGLDYTALESYLSDAEFEKVFKMTRAQFQELKGWRQADKKKQVGLF